MLKVAICCLFSRERSDRIKMMSVIVKRYAGANTEAYKTLAPVYWHFSVGFDECVTRRVGF